MGGGMSAPANRSAQKKSMDTVLKCSNDFHAFSWGDPRGDSFLDEDSGYADIYLPFKRERASQSMRVPLI